MQPVNMTISFATLVPLGSGALVSGKGAISIVWLRIYILQLCTFMLRFLQNFIQISQLPFLGPRGHLPRSGTEFFGGGWVGRGGGRLAMCIIYGLKPYILKFNISIKCYLNLTTFKKPWTKINDATVSAPILVKWAPVNYSYPNTPKIH